MAVLPVVLQDYLQRKREFVVYNFISLGRYPWRQLESPFLQYWGSLLLLFFFPSSIFGGVVGLIGCFSFGFFMLVMYFIWQRGLTALLEIEFIFFYSSHMPLGWTAFVNKNVFFCYINSFSSKPCVVAKIGGILSYAHWTEGSDKTKNIPNWNSIV